MAAAAEENIYNFFSNKPMVYELEQNDKQWKLKFVVEGGKYKFLLFYCRPVSFLEALNYKTSLVNCQFIYNLLLMVSVCFICKLSKKLINLYRIIYVKNDVKQDIWIWEYFSWKTALLTVILFYLKPFFPTGATK